MEIRHKELSDKEIALELVKLVKITPNSASDTNEDKSLQVVQVYTTILKAITSDQEIQH